MAKITVPLHIDRGKYSIGDESYASSSTRRYLLCRPQSGGRQRAGRYAPRAHHSKRHRQPPQPDGDRRRDQTGKANLPTHISLAARSCGLTRDSVILLEQVRTLDKSRLRERMGRLDEPAMHQVDNAIAVSFGLPQ